ncbi:uncharacterized protein TNCV_4568821 [Trichonephila clavipes]|nr:uncharacterized protein TNCV_4568821 [Trichonephila clavipes]
MICDKGSQFVYEVFEHLRNRLGIKHVKTVVYRPQTNRTERVNRDLLQMIASFVNNNDETWEQFLTEFAYASRMAVKETTVKTPAKEARQNSRIQHEKWVKYFNRRKREVNIKVNDLMLVQTHPISSASKKVVAKFKPKFEGPYRFLSVQNNNFVIWKAGRRTIVNVKQVRIYHQKKSDEGVVEKDSSISCESEYQSNSSEFSRPRLYRSQGFRSNESREKQVENGGKTSVDGNKSGRREHWLRKRKKISVSNESSKIKIEKEDRLTEVSDHKRRLPSSISMNQVATKRNRQTEENNGQVLARGSRRDPAEERPLQSSRIQPGRSSPYNLSRVSLFRKNITSQGGTSLFQERPVQEIKSIQFATSSSVQTRWQRSTGESSKQKVPFFGSTHWRYSRKTMKEL